MTRGLTLRLALAMMAVALASAVLAGALTTPLVGRTAEDAVREPLERQADVLARLPTIVLSSGQLDSLAATSGVTLGVITADGTATGAALALSDRQRDEVLDGSAISTDGTLDGHDVLLEARPTSSGDGVVLATDLGVVETTKDRLGRRMLIVLGLGLLGAVLLSLLVATQLGRPLRATAAAARRMAHGERGVALPQSGTREVADVGEALGALDRALATSEGRQRQFLLSVSHELRTPLTAVRGYGEALADGVVPADDLAHVGRTLAAEAERMERYVADLLALARTESDDFSLNRIGVDVGDLVAATARAWADRASRSGIELSSAGSDSLTADTDPSRLRQVLDVLVDNAVRICPPGATVLLTARADADRVVVEVRDSGPGLTDDDRRDAFLPGVLHERYAAERGGAHGLGLAIAARLVHRLGGTIEADRAPEGGAAFRVTLPSTPPRTTP